MLCMSGSGIEKACEKGKEFSNGRMDQSMRDFGEEIWLMAREGSFM